MAGNPLLRAADSQQEDEWLLMDRNGFCKEFVREIADKFHIFGLNISLYLVKMSVRNYYQMRYKGDTL